MELLIIIGLIVLFLGFWVGVRMKEGLVDFVVAMLSLFSIFFIGSALSGGGGGNSGYDGLWIIFVGPIIVVPLAGYWFAVLWRNDRNKRH